MELICGYRAAVRIHRSRTLNLLMQKFSLIVEKKKKIGAFENQNPQLGALSKVTVREIYLLKY